MGSIAENPAHAVRAFYEDVLGGHQVWPPPFGDGGETLWFLVGEKLLEARVGGDDVPTPTELAVDAPPLIAERCWNAGFRVCVQDDARGRALLSVVDPLGRRIELRARGAEGVSVRPRSGERFRDSSARCGASSIQRGHRGAT